MVLEITYGQVYMRMVLIDVSQRVSFRFLPDFVNG